MATLLQLMTTPQPWLLLLAAALPFLLLGLCWRPPRLSRGWLTAGEGWALLIVTFGALAFLGGLLTLGPLFLVPIHTWEGIAQFVVMLWLTPAVLLLAVWLTLGNLEAEERLGWAGWLAAGMSLLGAYVLRNWIIEAPGDGTMLFAWAGAVSGGILARYFLISRASK